MHKRKFNKGQKIKLFLKTDGICAICGVELEQGWHADHVIPWSKGGATETWNGQPLCPKCSLEKGDVVVNDLVDLRRFQERYILTGLNKFESGQKIVVGDIHSGSGKTLAVLHVANEMHRRGLIKACMVFVPRLNLCAQFELDWKEASLNLYADPKMSKITHRNNDPPLLRGDAFGYVTTYASLVAQPDLHIQFAKSHPQSMLILDEAQQLGIGESHGTQSARHIEEIAQYVNYIQVVTGTPYRNDGSPLLFAKYTDPDERGTRYLEADVSATYLEGVVEGYLRPFEYELADGRAIYEYLGGNEELLQISEMKKGLYHVLKDEGFWSTMVDMMVKRLRDVQHRIDPRLCGLIGAFGQKQAQAILGYIKREHKDMKVLIAISDENRSQKNLREFKKGKYDILITVRMAYIGYDYKPISVVLMLSDFRDWGYLDQFFARGLRMIDDKDNPIPKEKQVLYAIVPDDPKMARYVDEKRKESERGLREREQRKSIDIERSQQQALGFTYGGEVTGRRAQGMNPDGDLDFTELPIIEQIQDRYQMAASPRTELARLLRDVGIPIPSAAEKLELLTPVTTTTKRPQLLEKEKEKKARDILHRLAKRCDRQYAKSIGIENNDEVQWGRTMIKCNHYFRRKSIKAADLNAINESIEWVQNELERLESQL